MKEYEPSNQIPTKISPEAQDAANLILGVFTEFMAEFGIVSKRDPKGTNSTIAKTIQHAINRYVERRDS